MFLRDQKTPLNPGTRVSLVVPLYRFEYMKFRNLNSNIMFIYKLMANKIIVKYQLWTNAQWWSVKKPRRKLHLLVPCHASYILQTISDTLFFIVLWNLHCLLWILMCQITVKYNSIMLRLLTLFIIVDALGACMRFW